MLKGTVPPLNGSNPYPPGTVRSAALTLPSTAPAPAPPFPASTAITSAALVGPRSTWCDGEACGDTWPSALTAAGRTFAWVCDTAMGPMGLMELHGDPYARALAPSIVAPDPLNWTRLCAPFHPGPNVNVKPGGMAEVDGTLFVGATCITYGQDSTLFIRQHDLAGFVAASRDNGTTWDNVTAVGAFPGRFSAPVFTNCGAGQPCPDPDSSLNWTYVFFTGSAYNDWTYWENGDAHFLARVAPDAASVANPGAYQYYAGPSGGPAARPQWTPDATQAQPVLAFGRMLGQNAIHYNAHIGRWLVANYGFVSNTTGDPWPWHQLPWHTLDTPRRTQLIMLEAPQPWGPWSIFYRDDDAGSLWNGSGLYGTTFPQAYHRPVAPDGSAEMIMLFSCGNGGPGCDYMLNYINVTVQLSQEGRAHAVAAEARRTVTSHRL